MSKRRDAVECKDVPSLNQMFPYVMKKRADAEVCMKQTYDITDLMKYCADKKAQGLEYKPFHAVIYAVAKTLYLRPKMNRFISGKKFWQRNDIIMAFVAKQKFEDDAKETMIFLKMKPEMTGDDVSHVVIGDVKKAKAGSDGNLGNAMDIVASLPRFIKEIFFNILYMLEYFGKMPKALTDGDTNYSSVLLSNLGSIGVDSCYHHLSNYGTNSIMITVGKYYEKNGRMLLPMTITIDERMADGFYYAKSLRIAKFLLENPKYLDERIDAPIPLDVETGKLIVEETKEKAVKKTATKKASTKKVTKKETVKKAVTKKTATKKTKSSK